MNNLKTILEQNKDSNYKDFNRKLITTKYPIKGVRIPILRKLAKENNFQDFKLNDNMSHEEILYYGFSASHLKTEAEQLDALKQLLPYIDNWCTCDCIVASMKKLCKQNSYEFFTETLKDEREFYIRVGIIGLMRFFIKSDKIEDTVKNIMNIKSQDYYVKMAIAWFMAELCLYNPDLAKKSIANIQDKFTRNKAISKAKESFRINNDLKEELSKLRI